MSISQALLVAAVMQRFHTDQRLWWPNEWTCSMTLDRTWTRYAAAGLQLSH